ncbi:hypothetical protein PG994_001371 [Apiospora phragmitis]|uniref:Uncharacterized protein n=1 Tax=Apiospora phragmitis TaxID=2905665 RepID=A0ABR1WTD1_9PEZI
MRFHIPGFPKARRSSANSGSSASSAGDQPVQILAGSADRKKLKATLGRKNRGGYRLEVLLSSFTTYDNEYYVYAEEGLTRGEVSDCR